MGYIDDVVAGVTVPTAEWANAIRDQGVATFADDTARDTAITAPAEGQVVYLGTEDEEEGLWVQTSDGQWRRNWNTPWGLLSAPIAKTTDTTATDSYVDASGLTITTPVVPANRWLKWELTCHTYSSVAGDLVQVALRTAGNSVIGIGDQTAVTADFATALSWRWVEASTAAALTRKVSVRRNFGTGTVHLFADTNRPAILTVEDIGPSGGPA